MKKGEVYEAIIEEYEFPNKGYVHVEDRTFLVKGGLPGQKVRFLVKRVRKDVGEGRLLEVVEKSELEDVTPKCPHFGLCGGCAYQSMSYENQLQLKSSMVKKLLDKAIDYEYTWEGIKGSPVTEEYRNKMEFTFGDEYKDGPLSVGQHKKGGYYDILTVEGCRIVDVDYRKILTSVRDFYGKTGIPFYRKLQHVGVLRHLVIRKSVATSEILINLVTTTKAPEGEDLKDYLKLDEFVQMINSLELDGTVAGILHTENDSLSDTVVADRVNLLYGRDYITEKLLGLTFKISPFSFFQTNSRSAEVLYETAREYVGDTRNKVVFDLYSGTGTIAQLLAEVADRVYGVEIVEEAVVAAKENAKLNNLENCDFIAGDVLKVLDDLKAKPDVIVVDPPRDGIHPKALPKILDYGVDEIVYISCKPTSLARDLATFHSYGYRVVKAVAVDQFVSTSHVESCVLLERVSNRKADSYVKLNVRMEDYYRIKDAEGGEADG